MRVMFLVPALLALTSCTTATFAETTCAEPARPWADAAERNAAADSEGLQQARLLLGEAVRLRLRPDGEVAYLTLPAGAGEAESFGGLAEIRIEQAGNYTVNLDTPSWVDLVREGRAAESSAHGHGPACSGVRKAVVFPLESGVHVLELSGSKEPVAGVQVVSAP